MKRGTRCFLSLLTLIAFGAGCAGSQQVNVRVDSLARSDSVTKRTYVLLPGNRGTRASDLEFQEYAAYVHRALAARGLAHARRVEDADVVVFLSYGIGDPQTHYYAYSLPVWGQTGYSGSTTYGSVNTFGGYGTYSGTTTYTPTYGIAAYSTHLGSTTTHFRFILLDAYDLAVYKREKKLNQVWRSTITSTGSSGDLRQVFPVMVAASARHLATSTGQKVDITLGEDDAAVHYIKGLGGSQPAESRRPRVGIDPGGPGGCPYGMYRESATGQCRNP